jgi:hypothetical protein
MRRASPVDLHKISLGSEIANSSSELHPIGDMGLAGQFLNLGTALLLCNGFMSQDNTSADVGGLSIFLCFPKTRDLAPVAFNQDRAQLCQHLDLDMYEETLNFYLQEEFTAAKDVHELQIQAETFRNLLELLTCHDPVVTQGLSVVLRDFKKHYIMIQEMFVIVPQFRLKLLNCLDHQIQWSQVLCGKLQATWPWRLGTISNRGPFTLKGRLSRIPSRFPSSGPSKTSTRPLLN